MQGKQRATTAGLGAGKEADGGRGRRWGPWADDVTDASGGARFPRPWLLSCATKRRHGGGNQQRREGKRQGETMGSSPTAPVSSRISGDEEGVPRRSFV